jgi:hypothetical protein
VQSEQKDSPSTPRERALELQPFSADPTLEVRGIEVLAKDPVMALRESLNGAVLVGHQFDEKGVLNISGIVRDEEHRKDVEKKVADSLKDQGIEVKANGMKLLSEDKLPRLLQKILAAADSESTLRRTRLDRASFRYAKADGKNEPELQLLFHGVHLSEAGLSDEEKKLADKEKKDLLAKRSRSVRTAIETALLKAAGKAIEDELMLSLPSLSVVADAIEVSEDSPRNDLQGLVYDHNDLPGVRVKEIAFDKDGKLTIDVRGANDAQKKVIEKLITDLKRLQELLKKKDDNKVSRGNSESIRSRASLVVQVVDDASDRPHDVVLRQLQKQLSADPILSRTRIDRYGWKYDGANAKLLVNGVAVSPGDRMKEISAKLIPLIEKAEGEKLTVTLAIPDRFKINATSAVVTLQESSTRVAALNGMLVTDVYYSPTGRLTVAVLSPNSKRQEGEIKTLVGERAGLPAEFVAAAPWSKDKEAGTLALDVREPQSASARKKDWPAFISELRVSLSQGTRLERQTYVESAHFAYGKDEQTLTLVFNGICLDPAKDKARVGRMLQLAVDAHLKEVLKPDDAARVRDHHTRWTADAQVSFETPQRGLQEVVAITPPLDGVGIASAFFDKDGGLIFEAICQETSQEKTLGELTKKFLEEKGRSLKKAKFAFELKPLDTRSLLRGLREYAADNLNEVWIARLFFDADGTLTARGVLADDKEYTKVRDELVRLLRKHPKMKGHFKVENLTSIATEAPEGTPLLDLKEQGPLAANLRERYQGRSSTKRPPPSPRWDGVMLRRGYYTPDGKFGLDGLCDSARQREDLYKDLLTLRKEPPFLDAFAVGLDVSKLRELPMRPMVDRMRLVMPAHPTFDGIFVEGANHDVDNKLVLRVQVVGDEPSDRAGTAMQKQLLDHKQWWERAKDGVVWAEVGTPRARDARAGDALSRRAIADLRRAMHDPKMSKRPSESNEGQIPWPAHFDRALGQATTSLMHDSRSSTAWFVRAMYFLLKNDRVRAARDLRRMYEIEMDEDRGPGQREDRLLRTEALQGKVRRQLNLIERQIAKDIKAGVGPMTIAGSP